MRKKVVLTVRTKDGQIVGTFEDGAFEAAEGYEVSVETVPDLDDSWKRITAELGEIPSIPRRAHKDEFDAFLYALNLRRIEKEKRKEAKHEKTDTRAIFPEHVEICGKPFRIQYEDMDVKRMPFGEINLEECVIRIDRAMPKTVQMMTLFYETIYAISELEELRFTDKENTIQSLAIRLYDAFGKDIEWANDRKLKTRKMIRSLSHVEELKQ